MGPPHLTFDRLQLKWRLIFSFAIFESASVGLDELDGICDQLKVASLSALVCFPFLLVQCADDANAGSLVKILFCDLSKLVKTGNLDSVGLFL
jgi:hypothetical protein